MEGGECGRQPASTSMLQGSGVVEAAVAGLIERHCRRDVLAFEARDQDVVGAGVGQVEEVRRHAGDAQVFAPVGWSEFDLRPGQADVVESHCHRAR